MRTEGSARKLLAKMSDMIGDNACMT